MFGGLLDRTVKSVYACGEDIEILESFTFLGSVIIAAEDHAKKSLGALAQPQVSVQEDIGHNI